MDGKLILAEKESTAGYVYHYTDRNGFLPLLEMHTLERSLALYSQRYFDLSAYRDVLARKLKGFAYSEGEVGGLWLSFPRSVLVVFNISNFCEA